MAIKRASSSSSQTSAKHHTLIFSLVVVARLVRNAVSVGVLIDGGVDASLARPSIATVDHMLDRQVRRRPCPAALDVDTISQRARGSHCPA